MSRRVTLQDLDRAIVLAEDAVDTPKGDTGLATLLSNLGGALHRRAEQFDSLDDLDRAVEVCYESVNCTPKDHPSRASRLNTLSNALYSRFLRTRVSLDLDAALE